MDAPHRRLLHAAGIAAMPVVVVAKDDAVGALYQRFDAKPLQAQ